MNGKIKWYRKEKGFGFITGEDGKDYFFHHSAFSEQIGDKREEDNIAVSFEPQDTEKGLQAINIVIK